MKTKRNQILSLEMVRNTHTRKLMSAEETVLDREKKQLQWFTQVMCMED
jgi:hypothetical protein